MITSTSASNPADPAVLGVFGFAFATFLGSLLNLGIIHSSDVMVCTAIFLGGFGQLLAGLLSYQSRNLFGLTTFGAFGLFWIASGVQTLLLATGKIPPAGTVSTFWYLLLWAVVVFSLFIASLRASRVLGITMGLADLMLWGLALGTITGEPILFRAGAVCGLIASLLAIYIGTSTIWNDTFGRNILPLGRRT